MAAISTSNLDALPSVDDLKRLFQSLATLDSIMALDEGGEYFRFQSRWGRNQQMGSMSNGSGDELFAYFNRHGCFVKGFAHESPMSPYRDSPPQLWPGLLENVPVEFNAAVKEPAFDMDATTFAIWRLYADDAWQSDEIEYPDHQYADGSEDLLSMLDGSPSTYAAWAADYYETEIDFNPVKHVYDLLPLSNDILHSLNPDASIGQLHNCFVQIGYPGF